MFSVRSNWPINFNNDRNILFGRSRPAYIVQTRMVVGLRTLKRAVLYGRAYHYDIAGARIFSIARIRYQRLFSPRGPPGRRRRRRRGPRAHCGTAVAGAYVATVITLSPPTHAESIRVLLRLQCDRTRITFTTTKTVKSIGFFFRSFVRSYRPTTGLYGPYADRRDPRPGRSLSIVTRPSSERSPADPTRKNGSGRRARLIP